MQLIGELVPTHTAAVGTVPSTAKLRRPVGGADPEKLTRAMSSTVAVPEMIESGVTVTVEVGWGDTIMVALPVAAL